MSKTLNNSDEKGTRKQVGDLEVFGDNDLFQLICKASSKKEGWMKSTKAMNINQLGCALQVTTQQGDQVAEAVCFIPGARIHEGKGGYRCIVKGHVGVKQREISCPQCKGEGSIPTNQAKPGHEMDIKNISCDLCWGLGQLLAEPIMRPSP